MKIDTTQKIKVSQYQSRRKMIFFPRRENSYNQRIEKENPNGKLQ